MKLVLLVAAFVALASGPARIRFADAARALDGATDSATWMIVLFAFSLGAALSLTLRPLYWRGFFLAATGLGLLFVIVGVVTAVPALAVLIVGSCSLVCGGAAVVLWLRAEVFHVTWKR